MYKTIAMEHERSRGDALKYRVIGIVFILLLLGTGGLVHASWASYTIEEMYEKADVIVLATIEGEVATYREDGVWYTDWGVVVHSYIREDGNTYEKIVVRTPGASRKRAATSIDYKLDYRGKEVLLFLQRRNDRLEPITPYAVQAIRGGMFRLIDVPEEEWDDLYFILQESDQKLPTKDEVSPLYIEIRKSSTGEWFQQNYIYLLLGGIALGMIALYFARKKRIV